MVSEDPTLKNIQDLILEFLKLWNHYVNIKLPGNKLNTNWWTKFLRTLPNSIENKELLNGIYNGVRLGINNINNIKLVRIPTNIISSIKELEELLKVINKDMVKRNKQPTHQFTF